MWPGLGESFKIMQNWVAENFLILSKHILNVMPRICPTIFFKEEGGIRVSFAPPPTLPLSSVL